MSYQRRFTAVPQLEVIRASDDTVRAELIAAPVVRTDAGVHVIRNPAAVAGMALADDGAGAPRPAA